MIRRALRLIVTLAGCISLAAQVGSPDRKVEGNAIVSAHDPAARVEVPKSAQYVGGDRFVLYEVADCELHAFVEADSQHQVQRLYWVQFEGYLPSQPDLHHTYDSPQHAEIGGMDFYVDTWVGDHNSHVRSGSDTEHILTLIQGKGFHMPEGMLYARLVHLLDAQKRKELMIIYAEDLAPTKLTSAQLQKSGAAFDRWPAITSDLVERAKARVKVEASKPQ
jgi:hypothetical protein